MQAHVSGVLPQCHAAVGPMPGPRQGNARDTRDGTEDLTGGPQAV